jgi:hypothetical protein
MDGLRKSDQVAVIAHDTFSHQSPLPSGLTRLLPITCPAPVHWRATKFRKEAEKVDISTVRNLKQRCDTSYKTRLTLPGTLHGSSSREVKKG